MKEGEDSNTDWCYKSFHEEVILWSQTSTLVASNSAFILFLSESPVYSLVQAQKQVHFPYESYHLCHCSCMWLYLCIHIPDSDYSPYMAIWSHSRETINGLRTDSINWLFLLFKNIILMDWGKNSSFLLSFWIALSLCSSIQGETYSSWMLSFSTLRSWDGSK